MTTPSSSFDTDSHWGLLPSFILLVLFSLVSLAFRVSLSFVAVGPLFFCSFPSNAVTLGVLRLGVELRSNSLKSYELLSVSS